ncbi:unnamed protein product [Cuscuta epithymum]|uniref:Uncharacterized protein n=1 Tax=Cuscuta epithymum TaxID=186058 RepID=A0AAV0CEI1_9ASTE|nr:unnamed protein product [Cuscuta epithymum]
MATTFSLLQLPVLSSSKQKQPIIPKSFSSIPIRPNPPQISQNPLKQTINSPLKFAPLPLSCISLTFLFDAQDAIAVGGEFGILEGRSFAMIHPIVMSGLFVYTLYAGFLGWQWRRVRTLQDEISELKKQARVPVIDDTTPTDLSQASPVEVKIQQLTEERKALVKGSFRDRHFNAGSVLLGFGVFEAISGGFNTWVRTGKLFPGPHLFAGAAITVLWAVSAALVPAMQKGSESARNLHIALNVLNVLLFMSQIPSGIEILFKAYQFTSWP